MGWHHRKLESPQRGGVLGCLQRSDTHVHRDSNLAAGEGVTDTSDLEDRVLAGVSAFAF